MCSVIVLYPSGHDFDMDYYLSRHMKTIDENWGPMGLQSWEILQFPQDAPYQVQCTMKWETEAACDAARAAPGGKIIASDVPNYFKAMPVVLKGLQKATSSTNT